MERQADIPSVKSGDAGRDRGIDFLKHPNKWRNKMTLNFFGSLAKLLGGRRQSATYRNDLMTWAKTEYPNDWEFAYNYMITHNGRSPSYTHVTGVTL